MATFSERYEYKPVRAALGQYESMDEGLRVAIWNFLYNNYMHGDYSDTTENILLNVIGQPLDLVEHTRIDIVKLRQWYAKIPWNEVYDLLEFCIKYPSQRAPQLASKEEGVNDILSREGSAYRVVDGLITPISDLQEAIEVEEGANSSKHIRKAIELMANRNNPDYENVIKESISAVEYEVREAKGEEIVRGLEKLALHPQLAQAWKNMYHWASQEPGVRHANTEESKVGMAEARYVLIAASAFVNYLKLKGQQ